MIKKFAALFAAMALLLCTACGDGADSGSSKPIQHYPVTVGDCEIPAMPQKVVSLSPSVTDIILALGLSSKLVGVSNSCPNESGLPVLGSAVLPDCDGIIELGANVVLTSEPPSAEDRARLETHGIKLAVIPFASSLETLKQSYFSVAAVFAGNINGRTNADVTTERYNATLEHFRGAGDNFRFAFVIDSSSGFTPDTLAADILTKLGGTNTAAGTKYACDAGQIAAKNPTVLFCFKGDRETIMQNEKLKETDAVKSGRVYEVDSALVERQGEQVEGLIEVLGTALSEESSSGASDIS